MKKILAIILFSITLLLMAGCSKKNDYDYILEKGEITVGYTLFEPIAYNDDNGELTGFDIELAKLTAKELGLDVKFRLINWESKELELKSKSIDLIWNGLTVTEERKQTMEFSISYLANNQVAVIKKSDSSKFKTEDDLFSGNYTYCAESGSAGEEVISASGKECRQMSDMVSCLTEVRSGTDVAVMDSVMANYYVKQYTDLMVVDDVYLAIEEYGIAARKGDTVLISKINEALASLKDDGKLDLLADKYNLGDYVLVNMTDNSADSINNNSNEFIPTIKKMFKGFGLTVLLFILTLVFSLILGLIISLIGMVKFKPIKYLIKCLIWIIRGTPLMLQIIVVFYVPGLLFNARIESRMVAVLVAFIINYSCYFSEIYRGGIESISKGQYEACQVLGMSKIQAFMKVILPQVIKRIIPSMGNEVMTLVKDTSLARIIAVEELLFVSFNVMSTKGFIYPLFIAGLFYLIFNGFLTILLSKLEKKLDYYRG